MGVNRLESGADTVNSLAGSGAGRINRLGLGRKLVFIRPSLSVGNALHCPGAVKDSYDQLSYHDSWH